MIDRKLYSVGMELQSKYSIKNIMRKELLNWGFLEKPAPFFTKCCFKELFMTNIYIFYDEYIFKVLKKVYALSDRQKKQTVHSPRIIEMIKSNLNQEYKISENSNFVKIIITIVYDFEIRIYINKNNDGCNRVYCTENGCFDGNFMFYISDEKMMNLLSDRTNIIKEIKIQIQNFIAEIVVEARELWTDYSKKENYLPLFTGDYDSLIELIKFCNNGNMQAKADYAMYLFLSGENVDKAIQLASELSLRGNPEGRYLVNAWFLKN